MFPQNYSFQTHFSSFGEYTIAPTGALDFESFAIRRIFTKKMVSSAPALSSMSLPRRQTNSALCLLFFALTSAHGNRISIDSLSGLVSKTRISARLVCFEASRYFLSVRPMFFVMTPGGMPLHFFASDTKDAFMPALERNSGFEKNKSAPAIDANEMNKNQKRTFTREGFRVLIKKRDRRRHSRRQGHQGKRETTPRLCDEARWSASESSHPKARGAKSLKVKFETRTRVQGQP